MTPSRALSADSDRAFFLQVAEKGPSAAFRSIRSLQRTSMYASTRGFLRAPCIWTFLSNLSKWFFSILFAACRAFPLDIRRRNRLWHPAPDFEMMIGMTGKNLNQELKIHLRISLEGISL